MVLGIDEDNSLCDDDGAGHDIEDITVKNASETSAPDGDSAYYVLEDMISRLRALAQYLVAPAHESAASTSTHSLERPVFLTQSQGHSGTRHVVRRFPTQAPQHACRVKFTDCKAVASTSSRTTSRPLLFVLNATRTD